MRDRWGGECCRRAEEGRDENKNLAVIRVQCLPQLFEDLFRMCFDRHYFYSFSFKYSH